MMVVSFSSITECGAISLMHYVSRRYRSITDFLNPDTPMY